MSSPVEDFVVVGRELPAYLAQDQVWTMPEEVARRNLALLAAFSSKKDPRGRVLVKAETRELELAQAPTWSYSWDIAEKRAMLQAVAASFRILRQAAAERRDVSFTVTETKEKEALTGLREIAAVMRGYWKDLESADDALALAEKLKPLSRASSGDSIVELKCGVAVSSNSPTNVRTVGVAISSSMGRNFADYEQMDEEGSPLADQAWWNCLNRKSLPSSRCGSPCCCSTWCFKWLKPNAAME